MNDHCARKEQQQHHHHGVVDDYACTLHLLLVIRARAYDQSKEKEAQPKEDDFGIGINRTNENAPLLSSIKDERERETDREKRTGRF